MKKGIYQYQESPSRDRNRKSGHSHRPSKSTPFSSSYLANQLLYPASDITIFLESLKAKEKTTIRNWWILKELITCSMLCVETWKTKLKRLLYFSLCLSLCVCGCEMYIEKQSCWIMSAVWRIASHEILF